MEGCDRGAREKGTVDEGGVRGGGWGGGEILFFFFIMQKKKSHKKENTVKKTQYIAKAKGKGEPGLRGTFLGRRGGGGGGGGGGDGRVPGGGPLSQLRLGGGRLE